MRKQSISTYASILVGTSDWIISIDLFSSLQILSPACWNLLLSISVVSQTRAENQMETCGVHLDGTLFLPAQGRTPRVPVKAAKGSCAERSQASSFIGAKQASYKSGSCGYLCIALGSGGTFACLLLISLFQLTSFLFLIHSSDLQEVFCLAMLIIA